MMKKIMILMFVLLMTINISYGEIIITNDTFDYSETSLSELSYTKSGQTASPLSIKGIYINDVTTFQGFDYMVYSLPTSKVNNAPLIQDYDTTIDFYIDGDKVGTGIFGYSKSSDLLTTYIHLHSWEGEINIGSFTGGKFMSFSGNSINNIWFDSDGGVPYGYHVNPSTNPIYGFYAEDATYKIASGVIGYLSIYSDYTMSLPFSYTSTDNFNSMYMDRNAINQTKTIISIAENEKVNETSLTSTDFNYVTNDKINYTWDVSMENVYGDIDYKELIFTYILPQTSATITNNQTSYTNPEIILSEIVLNEPDYNNYYYRVKVMYEKYSNSYDYAVVNYNQSQIISSDNIQYEIDINENYYDLPTKFKIIVESYNKNSGESVIIGESNIFVYNPSDFYDNIINGLILDTTTNAYISNVDIYYNNSLTSYHDISTSYGKFKFYLPTDLYNIHIEKVGYHVTNFSQYIDNSETTKIYITPLDENINLYGNILDLNTNLPLSDVKITVSNTTFTQFTYSNNYGYYEFYNIQNNTNYTLIAELDNYYSFNELIIIPSDAPKYQLINLIPIINDIDTDIDQQIEDLKEEIQPIKDLIFGLSEIVIDNPDYNNDNIISENEYASFINSLVSLVLVIFIVIMYIGLKDRREKR